MDKEQQIKEKIDFVKVYWTRILKGQIDIFLKQSEVDLEIIFRDMIKKIDFIINNERPSSDLKYLVNEYRSFYNVSYFYRENLYKKELQIIKDSSEEIVKRSEKKSYPQTQRLKDMVNEMLEQLNNKQHFFSIVEEIQSICCGSLDLIQCGDILKIYIIEAIYRGYNNLMSYEYLESFWNISIKLGNDLIIGKVKEDKQIASYIQDFMNKGKKRHYQKVTYIFSVENMHLNRPFRYEDENIIFYNPMRRDLLECELKEKWFNADYRLLTQKQQKFWRENGEGWGNSLDEGYEEVIYQTDCHTRITIDAIDGKEGVDRAKSYINGILNLIQASINQGKERLKCANTYDFIEQEPEEMQQRSSSIPENNKRQEIYYTINQLEWALEKMVKDKDSLFNLIRGLKNKEVIETSIMWFEKALQEDNTLKFIYLMVCIESVLGKITGGQNIKAAICNIGAKAIIKHLIQAEIEIVLISQSKKYIKEIERQEIINDLNDIEKSKIIEWLHSEHVDGNYINNLIVV